MYFLKFKIHLCAVLLKTAIIQIVVSDLGKYPYAKSYRETNTEKSKQQKKDDKDQRIRVSSFNQ